MKEGDPVRQFFDLLQAGMRQLGCHQWGALGVVQSLEQAGFVNVQRTMKKVPLGPWARDNMLRQIGMMSKAFMEGSLHGLGAKPFEALGLSPEESAKVVDEALASLDDNSIHRYTRFWVCYGQKGPNVYES